LPKSPQFYIDVTILSKKTERFCQIFVTFLENMNFINSHTAVKVKDRLIMCSLKKVSILIIPILWYKVCTYLLFESDFRSEFFNKFNTIFCRHERLIIVTRPEFNSATISFEFFLNKKEIIRIGIFEEFRSKKVSRH